MNRANTQRDNYLCAGFHFSFPLLFETKTTNFIGGREVRKIINMNDPTAFGIALSPWLPDQMCRDKKTHGANCADIFSVSDKQCFHRMFMGFSKSRAQYPYWIHCEL